MLSLATASYGTGRSCSAGSRTSAPAPLLSRAEIWPAAAAQRSCSSSCVRDKMLNKWFWALFVASCASCMNMYLGWRLLGGGRRCRCGFAGGRFLSRPLAAVASFRLPLVLDDDAAATEVLHDFQENVRHLDDVGQIGSVW